MWVGGWVRRRSPARHSAPPPPRNAKPWPAPHPCTCSGHARRRSVSGRISAAPSGPAPPWPPPPPPPPLQFVCEGPRCVPGRGHVTYTDPACLRQCNRSAGPRPPSAARARPPYRNAWGDVRGVNYVPSYSRNDIQTWMDYDAATVERELGYARDVGLNAVRVFLSVFPWVADRGAFLARYDHLVAACAARGIRPLVVLFDDDFFDVPGVARASEIARWLATKAYRNEKWMANPGGPSIPCASDVICDGGAMIAPSAPPPGRILVDRAFSFFFLIKLIPYQKRRPPTAVGYPPTAVGYPPTAVGYPPTAVGYPPTAVGHTQPSSVTLPRPLQPPSKRRWLPFRCRPIVCLNTQLATGRLQVCFFQFEDRPGLPPDGTSCASPPAGMCILAEDQANGWALADRFVADVAGGPRANDRRLLGYDVMNEPGRPAPFPGGLPAFIDHVAAVLGAATDAPFTVDRYRRAPADAEDMERGLSWHDYWRYGQWRSCAARAAGVCHDRAAAGAAYLADGAARGKPALVSEMGQFDCYCPAARGWQAAGVGFIAWELMLEHDQFSGFQGLVYKNGTFRSEAERRCIADLATRTPRSCPPRPPLPPSPPPSLGPRWRLHVPR